MKRFNLTISALLRQQWAINIEAAQGFLPLIEDYLGGRSVVLHEGRDDNEEESVEQFCAFITPGGESMRTKNLADVPNGSIAVMDIDGPLMKADYCGDPGMASMGNVLQQWDNEDSISGVVLNTNSPGGTVDGTETLASIIAGMKKPCVCFVDGTAGSGAYWLGSQADHIMMSGNTSSVGSIGIALSIRDMRKADEQRGVTTHYITADTSPDKNKDYLEAKEGNYTLIKQDLKDMHKIFQNAVKSGRTGIDDSALTGKMYSTKKALKLGMADSVGTLNDAVNLTREMAKTSTSNNNNNMKFNFFSPSKTKVEVNAEDTQAHIVALEAERDAAFQSVSVLETRATTAEAALEASESKITALQTRISALQGTHASLEEAFSAKDNTIVAQATTIAELGAQPGARGTTPKAKEDDKPDHPDAKMSWFDPEAEHNKDLAERIAKQL